MVLEKKLENMNAKGSVVKRHMNEVQNFSPAPGPSTLLRSVEQQLLY